MDVIPLVQAVKNVQTQLVHVPAMLDTRVPNVTLHVVVIPLVQVALHVISQQANVHVILDTQEPHVTLVTPTTIQLVLEQLVQVSVSNSRKANKSVALKGLYFQPVDVIPLVQAVKNVQTQPVHVPAMLDTRGPNVTLHVVVIPLVQVVHHVIRLQANVLVILDTLEPRVTLVTPTIIQQVLVQLVQVGLSYS